MSTDDLQVPGFGKRFVSFIEHHPWRALAVAALILAVLIPGGAKIEADFTYRAFFFDSDPLIKRFDAFERKFGNDDAIVVAVHSPSGVFDKDSAELIVKLTDRIWSEVPEVIRVDSLTNFNWVHAVEDEITVEPLIPSDEELTDDLLAQRKQIALAHETIPGYLVSKDAKTALIFGLLKPGIDKAPDDQHIVTELRKVLAAEKRTDHEFYVSGGPPLSYAFAEAMQYDLSRLVPLVLLITIVLTFIMIRSAVGVVLSLCVVFLSIMGAMCLSGHLGFKITNMTSILPQILIAIGVADSIHILVSFYRKLATGVSRHEAARYSLLKNLVPTILTSTSTAVGFFSFVTTPLKPMFGFGILTGFGVLIAWVMTYLFLGSMLFLLPLSKKSVPPDAEELRADTVRRYTNFMQRHAWAMVGVWVLITGFSIVVSTLNEVNSDPLKYFAKGVPMRIANEFIEKEVGGARSIEFVVSAGEAEGIKDPALLRKVDDFQKWMEGHEGVSRTISIVDILKQTNRSLNGGTQDAYKLPEDRETVAQELFLYTMSLPQGMDINDRVTLNNDALRVTAMMTIPTSRETVEFIRSAEKYGKEMGLSVEATGKNYLWQAMNGHVVNSLLWSFGSATVVVSLILIFAYGSISLGLFAMIPNIVPLVFGGVILWLIGQPLDMGTVMVLSVCLGIAVDDTIHILSNYNRLRLQGLSAHDAVVDIFGHTTPALVTTTVVLVCGFGAFIFASFTPNLYFGVLTAAILAFAMTADMTLTPALLMKLNIGEGAARKARARQDKAA